MKLKTVLLSVLTISLFCFAGDMIDRQSVLEESKNITLETYPNADDVLVDDYTTVKYNPDGTAVEVSETYLKILTEKAKRENQTLSYNFTIPYNELDVELVEIIKPDGSVVEIDADKEGREMIDRSQMSSNIYNPNDKIYQVSVSGLEKGDLLHTKITTKIVKPRMADSWSDYQVFEYTSPIRHMIYEVHAPKELPLASIALKDEQPSTVTYSKADEGPGFVHKWTVSNVEQIYPEPDMPPYWTVVQRLLISTNPDWPSVSRWYWELSKPHLEVNDEIIAKSEELINGIDDRDAQMRAIFKFVSQDIRYLGITVEKEAPGYEPHDVCMTFANRHGVCRDKAALLVAMLRAVGFDAYPVLIYSGPKKDEEVPQPYFNHAISAVRKENGDFILMDSTDESTGQLLPAYLNDCSYLVATPEGSELKVSPIEPAEENMMVIDTAAEMSVDGRYKAKSTLKFEGINDNAYRGFFLRSSVEERRQYFEAVVKRLLPGANLTSFELMPEDLQDTTRAISAVISYQADNVLIENDGMGAAAIYNVGDKVGMVNFIIGKTGLEKRRFPLDTGFACGVRENFSLDIPKGIEVVSLPNYQGIDDDNITWQRSIGQQNDRVSGSLEFKIKTVQFSPEEYSTLKRHLGDIEFNDSRKLILHKMEESPDAVIEYNDTHYSLTDKHNWKTNVRIKVRVLTYKGKKDLSELKFDFNPAWEELHILKAAVETGGEIKEISEQEINVMDAAWAGSAPRYPAGKTLVASLPGVEIGSVIEYEVEKISAEKPFFAATEVFGDYYPIKRKNVRLTVPAELEPQIIIDSNGLLIEDDGQAVIESSTSRTATTKSYEWQCSDIKAVERETSQPPLAGLCPVVKISTGSWEQYTARINGVLERFEMTREARMYPKKAADIVQYSSDDAEKIRKIRDYIAENIRPVGARFYRMPLSSLTKPDITMFNGYGNNMDRAILTAAMLRSLDIEARIILASEASRIEAFEKFAAAAADTDTFTRALVKVNAGDSVYYLGDSDQYGALGATASDKYQYLSLEDAQINRVEVAKEFSSRIDNSYNLKVGSDGSLRMKAEELSYGVYHGISNKLYAEMPPEQTRRYYQELIAQISQSAKAEGKLSTNFRQYPGVEQYSLIMGRYAVADNSFLYFEIPPVLPSLPEIREDDRQTPYYNPGYLNYRTSVTVELPEDFTPLLLPQDGRKELPGNAGSIEITTEIQDSSVKIIYDIKARAAVVSPDQCRNYADAISWLNNKNKRFIMLKRD